MKGSVALIVNVIRTWPLLDQALNNHDLTWFGCQSEQRVAFIIHRLTKIKVGWQQLDLILNVDHVRAGLYQGV